MQCYISALLLAFILLVIVHMCVFHAFSNLASELTRFADRQFYNVSLLVPPLSSFLPHCSPLTGLVGQHILLLLLSEVEHNSPRLDLLLPVPGHASTLLL